MAVCCPPNWADSPTEATNIPSPKMSGGFFDVYNLSWSSVS